MTVDEANTRLAIAYGIDERIAAYKALSNAACEEIARLEFRHSKDESEGYALITRLIEARNVLTLAAHYIGQHMTDGHGHRAIDELDTAMVHITIAIETL